MNRLNKFLILFLMGLIATGCGGGGSGAEVNTQGQTYSLQISDIQISRSADRKAMPVIRTPVNGAVITQR